MRVLFLTNIPSPYRVDFFNELGKLCDLTVIFERQVEITREKKWMKNEFNNFTSIFMKETHLNANIGFSFELIRNLSGKKYNIIIVGGYATVTGIFAINYMRLNRTPFVINADGGFIVENENVIKKIMKKHFISSATCYLSSGAQTTKYLTYYGADYNKTYVYPFTSLYKKDILLNQVSPDYKRKIKDELNIKEEKVILSVGRFINIKGFDLLINACKEIQGDIGVYIVGGKPTEEYIQLIEMLNLDHIHFLDFMPKEKLSKYYMASDIFVLPTRGDVWGLVINEAMAYGLPVITTDKCIAGIELIENYENGFIIHSNDADELSVRINELIKDRDLINKMSKNNLSKIQAYTIENMAMEHSNIFSEILDELATEYSHRR